MKIKEAMNQFADVKVAMDKEEDVTMMNNNAAVILSTKNVKKTAKKWSFAAEGNVELIGKDSEAHYANILLLGNETEEYGLSGKILRIKREMVNGKSRIVKKQELGSFWGSHLTYFRLTNNKFAEVVDGTLKPMNIGVHTDIDGNLVPDENWLSLARIRYGSGEAAAAVVTEDAGRTDGPSCKMRVHSPRRLIGRTESDGVSHEKLVSPRGDQGNGGDPLNMVDLHLDAVQCVS